MAVAKQAGPQRGPPGAHHVTTQSCDSRTVYDSEPSTSTHGTFTPAAGAQATVSIELTGPIDPYRFNMFMADLLAERGSDIKRMSGVLSVQGYGCHGTYFKFEGSQNTVTFGPTTAMLSDSSPVSVSLVSFTGFNLSEKDLREALETCAWLPVAPGWTEHYTAGVSQPFYIHQATGRKQWQRPAAVEPQPAITPQVPTPQAPSLSRQSCTSELSDTSLEEASIRSTLAVRRQSGLRAAVSCPCNASDACAAVFDIKRTGEQQRAKRSREDESADVTSKLAELDMDRSSVQVIDSADSFEALKAGPSWKHKKHRPSYSYKREVQAVKKGLRRSNSCQLHVQAKMPMHQLLELSH